MCRTAPRASRLVFEFCFIRFMLTHYWFHSVLLDCWRNVTKKREEKFQDPNIRVKSIGRRSTSERKAAEGQPQSKTLPREREREALGLAKLFGVHLSFLALLVQRGSFERITILSEPPRDGIIYPHCPTVLSAPCSK